MNRETDAAEGRADRAVFEWRRPTACGKESGSKCRRALFHFNQAKEGRMSPDEDGRFAEGKIIFQFYP